MSAVPNLPTEVENLPHTTNGAPPHASASSQHNPPTIPESIRTSFATLNNSPVENQRPIRIIVIGAGYSGIYLGIRIPEKLRNAEVVIYDKNAGVGGTWFENRYPGCACDVPSHSYQFSFSPNKNWSSLYAPAPEIQAYLAGVATKYSADRFIKLSHEVVGARWDQGEGKWHVKVRNLETGEEKTDIADVLISARGNLNVPAWPEIPGLSGFKGKVMHSSKWDESYDFTQKRTGVIGSGSSAIQIIPSLQRLPGSRLTTFIRSRTWISPPFSESLLTAQGLTNHIIPAALREKFHSDPEFYAKFRLAIEEDGNGVHPVTIKGTPMQEGAKGAFEEHMRGRLKSKEGIFESLLPTFSPGCRRLTPGPGFLEALTQPNVDFVTAPIVRITENAVVTEDGREHEIDALVCATGFQSSSAPPFPVVGMHGTSLKQRWERRAENYMSLAVDEFPNHFVMLGPNAAIGSGSLTMMIESVGSYIVKCIRKLQKENIKAMSVKSRAVGNFLEYADEYFKGTVFSEECRSWYRNGGGKGAGGGSGEVTGLWPGSTLHCIEALRSPRWEDYDYAYAGEEDDEDGGEVAVVDGTNGEVDMVNGHGKRARVDSKLDHVAASRKKKVNRMAWLGNGHSIKNLEEKDLAWYLYPQFVDQPVAPLPEEREEFRIRPFSH